MKLLVAYIIACQNNPAGFIRAQLGAVSSDLKLFSQGEKKKARSFVQANDFSPASDIYFKD